MAKGAPRARGPAPLSISAFAAAARMDRHTLTTKISRLRIEPADTLKGNPRYALSDLLRVYRGEQEQSDIGSMDAFRRKALVQSQREELKLAAERGEVIPADEVQDEISRVLKLVAQKLDQIPDILERDCGLSGRAVEIIERELDKLRQNLADELSADDNEPEGV
ncbi:DUF1441 family protein [Hydrocarboniphaga effusa]|uniref:DUF1441 family protein n=1 Tax=Hydrocarboniphaga effusa TaxID=243629 RepID=UPI00398C1F90